MTKQYEEMLFFSRFLVASFTSLKENGERKEVLETEVEVLMCLMEAEALENSSKDSSGGYFPFSGSLTLRMDHTEINLGIHGPFYSLLPLGCFIETKGSLTFVERKSTYGIAWYNQIMI